MSLNNKNISPVSIGFVIFFIVFIAALIDSKPAKQSKQTIKNNREQTTLNKDFSESKKVASGLNGLKVTSEKQELSKTIEKNGKASGLNGLDLE